MKRVLLIGLAVVLVGACMAGAASVVTSKHDLSTGGTTTFKSTNVSEVCVFCHTPHQPTGQSTDPLWNHTLSTVASYSVYTSTTLNATVTDIGGGSTVSNLCMSCHDGTIGLGSLMNNPGGGAGTTPSNSATVISGSALVGTDLSNDHPVNFPYNAALVTADGGLNDPSGAGIAPLLFGGTVQCASCHNPHDPQFGSFLVKSNAASALCVTCHIK